MDLIITIGVSIVAVIIVAIVVVTIGGYIINGAIMALSLACRSGFPGAALYFAAWIFFFPAMLVVCGLYGALLAIQGPNELAG